MDTRNTKHEIFIETRMFVSCNLKIEPTTTPQSEAQLGIHCVHRQQVMSLILRSSCSFWVMKGILGKT